MGDVYSNAAAEATRICEESIELEALAHRTLLVWRSVAAPHTGTGDYGRSLKIKREVYRGPQGRGRDYVVYTTDPNAMQIEYGHQLFADTNHDGEAEDQYQWVPGLRIANRAFDILKASGG